MSWYRSFNSKYNNKKQTIDGYSYDSKGEAGYAIELELRQKSGDIRAWDRQKKIELYGQNGTRICNYYIDFVITHNDGSTEYVEIKGFPTDVWKLKKKLMEDKIKGMENAKYTIIYI